MPRENTVTVGQTRCTPYILPTNVWVYVRQCSRKVMEPFDPRQAPRMHAVLGDGTQPFQYSTSQSRRRRLESQSKKREQTITTVVLIHQNVRPPKRCAFATYDNATHGCCLRSMMFKIFASIFLYFVVHARRPISEVCMCFPIKRMRRWKATVHCAFPTWVPLRQIYQNPDMV